MIVLAHGGGAPEAAMIGLPLVLFGVFLWLERRARRRESQAEEVPAGGEPGENGPARGGSSP